MAVTDARPGLAAHTVSVRSTFPAVVRELSELLGPKLVAYLARRARDARGARVGDGGARAARSGPAAAAARAPGRAAASRGTTAPGVVQAWFQGLNPQLDDRSPARLLREGELHEVGPEVLSAARAFTTAARAAPRARRADRPLHRIGRAPNPWAWPDWLRASPTARSATASTTRSATTACSTRRAALGAFVEVLARFRPDPHVARSSRGSRATRRARCRPATRARGSRCGASARRRSPGASPRSAQRVARRARARARRARSRHYGIATSTRRDPPLRAAALHAGDLALRLRATPRATARRSTASPTSRSSATSSGTGRSSRHHRRRTRTASQSTQPTRTSRPSLRGSASSGADRLWLVGPDRLPELGARLVPTLPLVRRTTERLARGLTARRTQRRVHEPDATPCRTSAGAPTPQPANLAAGARVLPHMTLKRALATTAAIATGLLAAASPAVAQERTPQGFVVDGPYSVHQGESNGIIAILSASRRRSAPTRARSTSCRTSSRRTRKSWTSRIVVRLSDRRTAERISPRATMIVSSRPSQGCTTKVRYGATFVVHP